MLLSAHKLNVLLQVVVVVVVVVVVTLTRAIKSAVTKQDPVALEWKNTNAPRKRSQ